MRESSQQLSLLTLASQKLFATEEQNQFVQTLVDEAIEKCDILPTLNQRLERGLPQEHRSHLIQRSPASLLTVEHRKLTPF
jgi:hypothetical protein